MALKKKKIIELNFYFSIILSIRSWVYNKNLDFETI